MRFGSLTIDPEARTVHRDGRPVDLTHSEFALLLALASGPGVARSNRELLAQMWGGDWLVDTSALQVHVSRLRRKLGESGHRQQRIVTIHGFGYRWDPGDGGPSEPRSAALARDTDGPTARWPEEATKAFFVASPSQVLEWVSGGVRAVLGWQPVDLVGTRFMELLHHDDAVLVRPVEEVLARRDGWAFVGRLRDPGGAFVPVRIIARPTFDQQERLTGFVGELTDADASHVRGYSSLSDQDHRHEGSNASAASPARVVEMVVDAEFFLREILPPEPFLGWSPDEIIGTRFSATGLTPEQMREAVAQIMSRNEREARGPILLHARDGSTIVAVMVTRLLIDEEGRFAGLHSRIEFA